MALAIHFDQLIRDGKVKDYSQLAKLGHVTRARVTQIMDLLSLAPAIQEEIMCLGPTLGGRPAVKERDLRHITAVIVWRQQREGWVALTK